mmetsp:Transcript_6771/g.16659  ORF Transcript_6771/g.16659 Transcript_6771/m.16659 type:complete len:202 (+) Transcript_6771:3-608(+)
MGRGCIVPRRSCRRDAPPHIRLQPSKLLHQRFFLDVRDRPRNETSATAEVPATTKKILHRIAQRRDHLLLLDHGTPSHLEFGQFHPELLNAEGTQSDQCGFAVEFLFFRRLRDRCSIVVNCGRWSPRRFFRRNRGPFFGIGTRIIRFGRCTYTGRRRPRRTVARLHQPPRQALAIEAVRVGYFHLPQLRLDFSQSHIVRIR